MNKYLYHRRVFQLFIFLFMFNVFFSHENSVIPTSAPGQSGEAMLLCLMYHSFTDGTDESEYVLNIKKLEDDIVYLKGKGFSFVDSNDLIMFSEGKLHLPDKCALISFDDGYLNNYLYAFPIIKKHKVKVVISPIAYFVEYYSGIGDRNPKYAQLSYEDISEMAKSGYVDFQNHSYNMHSLDKRNGSSKLDGEKSDIYIREFYYDLQKAESIIEPIINKELRLYVYPFGNISKESTSILKCCGYKLSLSCNEGVNFLSGKKDELFFLKRFNRTPERGAREIMLYLKDKL